jgi:hypothetical protein
MPTDAHPAWYAFHLPKRGNAAQEYEDALATDPAADRYAVADGASESSYSGLWARLLAEGFVGSAGKPWRDLDWLPPLRKRWAAEVDKLPLSWYAEMKREQGAFATLLGLAFRPPLEGQPGIWRALAVGDSCLFRTRSGRLLKAFPLSDSKGFGNQPRLLGSRSSSSGGFAQPAPEQAHGRWRPGDRFLLMTDALAQWFLHQNEEGGQPLEQIARLLGESDPRAAFAGWIEERRDRQDLRNDDVTLVLIDR